MRLRVTQPSGLMCFLPFHFILLSFECRLFIGIKWIKPRRCLNMHPIPFFLNSTIFSKTEQVSSVYFGQVYLCSDQPPAKFKHRALHCFRVASWESLELLSVCSHRIWGLVGRWDMICGKLTKNSGSRREVPMKWYDWYFVFTF